MGEEHRVGAGLSQLGDQRVDPRRDVGGGLAAGAAVPPQDPVRAPLADLRGGQSLVLAVVPLQQRIGALGSVAEAGELSGLGRPG